MFYLVRAKRTGEVEVIERDTDPSFEFFMVAADESEAYRIAAKVNAANQ
jgi:hypothetical protein